MTTPRAPYRVSEAPNDGRPAVTPQVIEGVDMTASDLAQPANGWRQQHPQTRRPARLEQQYAPYGVSAHAQDAHGATQGYHQAAPGTHVQVNNNSQLYRPWKEELLISGWKTFGNFLGWPFRLIGRLFENILNMFAGVLRTILLFVIAPTLLFTGYQFYQENKGRPATEIASDVGEAGVGLVGAVLGGIWDGIFGDDAEPDTPPAK